MSGVGKKRPWMTAKLRAMVEAYKGVARLNLSEAARIAGYSSPVKQAYQIRKKYPELFEQAEAEFRDSLTVSDQELDEAIANLVRSPAHRDHFKAVELVAKMKGRLDPKVTVQIERKDLASQLDETLKVLIATRQAQLVEGTVVTAEIPPPSES